MLTVGLAAYACEAVTVHNALETLTFGSTDDVHERDILFEDVGDCESVAKFELSLEVRLKFDELAPGSGSCL